MKNCLFCTNDFKPAKSNQKYCSNTCRVKAFNVHKNANLTPKLMYNNDTMNEPINAKKIIDETVERILAERQQVFETKLKAQEAEYNNKLMELRLSDLEKKVRDLEKDANKDEGGFGISMPDMVNAAATYFATKMSNDTPKT
jgi:hypothetical protein